MSFGKGEYELLLYSVFLSFCISNVFLSFLDVIKTSLNRTLGILYYSKRRAFVLFYSTERYVSRIA